VIGVNYFCGGGRGELGDRAGGGVHAPAVAVAARTSSSAIAPAAVFTRCDGSSGGAGGGGEDLELGDRAGVAGPGGGVRRPDVQTSRRRAAAAVAGLVLPRSAS
jgi:hypothetical protein